MIWYTLKRTISIARMIESGHVAGVHDRERARSGRTLYEIYSIKFRLYTVLYAMLVRLACQVIKWNSTTSPWQSTISSWSHFLHLHEKNTQQISEIYINYHVSQNRAPVVDWWPFTSYWQNLRNSLISLVKRLGPWKCVCMKPFPINWDLCFSVSPSYT